MGDVRKYLIHPVKTGFSEEEINKRMQRTHSWSKSASM